MPTFLIHKDFFIIKFEVEYFFFSLQLFMHKVAKYFNWGRFVQLWMFVKSAISSSAEIVRSLS